MVNPSRALGNRGRETSTRTSCGSLASRTVASAATPNAPAPKIAAAPGRNFRRFQTSGKLLPYPPDGLRMTQGKAGAFAPAFLILPDDECGRGFQPLRRDAIQAFGSTHPVR